MFINYKNYFIKWEFTFLTSSCCVWFSYFVANIFYISTNNFKCWPALMDDYSVTAANHSYLNEAIYISFTLWVSSGRKQTFWQTMTKCLLLITDWYNCNQLHSMIVVAVQGVCPITTLHFTLLLCSTTKSNFWLTVNIFQVSCFEVKRALKDVIWVV